MSSIFGCRWTASWNNHIKFLFITLVSIASLMFMMTSYPVITGSATVMGIRKNIKHENIMSRSLTYFNLDEENTRSKNTIYRPKLNRKLRSLQAMKASVNDQLDDFIASVEDEHSTFKLNKTVFGKQYTPSPTRMPTYDFPYIIAGADICKDVKPLLVIMVLSVHTHIDTRETIRKTWGRAAHPGRWPKIGLLNDTVRLVFLLGRGNKEIKNKIIEDEHLTYGDIMQADYIDSYYNLTLKVVSGLRWVAQFCPSAKYILKADEDVFVHIPNLINILKKQNYLEDGSIYGRLQSGSVVLRDGKWGVKNETFPLSRYPPYVAGNTYVISGNMAARMFYVAGHLPYMNIEDAFVCGIVRSFIGGHITDVIGFTHWYERKPRPCEFKNSIRISSTKTDDWLKSYIWDELKTNLTDCYKIVRTNTSEIIKRPDSHIQNRPSFRHSIRDEHIFYNKSNGEFYVV